jgi:hypothetical protein
MHAWLRRKPEFIDPENDCITSLKIVKANKNISVYLGTRKVFLPKTVAEMLVKWKAEQDE